MKAALSNFNLRLQIALLLQRYSMWLLIALGMMFLAALCFFLLIAPLKKKVDKLQQKLNTTLASLPSASLKKEPVKDTLQKQNKQLFDDTLIPSERLPEALVQIHKIAASQQLNLLKAEYQYLLADPFGLAQTKVTLPIKADYLLIRRFCENVLQAMPYVSLDEISFKRESIEVEQISTRIRFTVWMKTVVAQPSSNTVALEKTPE